jgi:hypothetical protein
MIGMYDKSRLERMDVILIAVASVIGLPTKHFQLAQALGVSISWKLVYPGRR